MEKIILLDVDGVLCNFIGGLIKSLKLGISHDEFTSWNYNRELGVSDEEMWQSTTGKHWWTNLSRYDYADDLFNALNELDYKIIFCTSPSRDYKCPSEKVLWLRLQGFLSENGTNYQIGPNKHLNAKSGAILIDDSDDNVNKYRENGGSAILFPQPWNNNRKLTHCRIEHTLNELEKITERE